MNVCPNDETQFEGDKSPECGYNIKKEERKKIKENESKLFSKIATVFEIIAAVLMAFETFLLFSFSSEISSLVNVLIVLTLTLFVCFIVAVVFSSIAFAKDRNGFSIAIFVIAVVSTVLYILYVFFLLIPMVIILYFFELLKSCSSCSG